MTKHSKHAAGALDDGLADQAPPPARAVDLTRSAPLRMGSFAFCALFFALFGIAAAFDWVNPRAAALLACAAGAMIAFADALYIRQMVYQARIPLLVLYD